MLFDEENVLFDEENVLFDEENVLPLFPLNLLLRCLKVV